MDSFRFGALAAGLAIAATISVQAGGDFTKRAGVTVRAAAVAAPDCAQHPAVNAVITALFGAVPASCDLNDDGALSAADVTAAILSLVVPIATATPSPSLSPTPEAPSPTVPPSTPTWTFTDVTEQAGLNYSDLALGGVAAGDYDGDGWTDLFMGPLLHNRGDGTFEEVPGAGGIVPGLFNGSAATFADFDGDGRLDLFVKGALSPPELYRNRGNGTFEDVAAHAGFAIDCECQGPGPAVNHGSAFGDYDRDGYLDLFVTHWGTPIGPPGRTIENLWHNNGNGSFRGVTAEAGVLGLSSSFPGSEKSSWMYTPNFADINNDGWPDLLIAADYGTSRVFVNNHDGTFTDTTNSVISDENGMGAAVGDYDNDGNLDWFVTSVWDPENPPVPYSGVTGNRLYRGHGDGTFEDVTDKAGVRQGDWGWGSCFADFNNDGHLDIFHVNGFIGQDDGTIPRRFFSDPSRLFIANGDGTFTERSRQLGIDDHESGQGVVCFDYDGDGDIDIFVANFGVSESHPPRLYRNNGGNLNNFLDVKLRGRAPNTEAIGARIYVTTHGQTQMRELRAGSNYLSQDPVVAHFGLADVSVVDAVRIVWPDQSSTTLSDVAARQRLVIIQP